MASSMPTSRVGGPAPTTARLGRELQRYSQDGERLLAGCVAAATLQCLPAYAGCVSLARGPACATGQFTVPVVLARWGTVPVQRPGARAAQAAGQGLHLLAQPGALLSLSVAGRVCSQASTLSHML